MAAPTITVPTTGTDPKDTTLDDLESAVNDALATNDGNIEAHKANTANPHGVTKAQVGLGNADNTSDADKPVSTAQQAALDAKAPLSHTQAAATISDSTAAGRAILTAATAASQRTALGLGSAALSASNDFATAAQGVDDREWTAETVSQAEAEARTATTRRAWNALRVGQSAAAYVTAWWSGSSWKAKLDNIAENATANATDATLLARANHTGTQAISTITGLQAELDARTDRIDTIGIADVTRPGENPDQFSSVVTGDPSARPAITIGTQVVSADLGKVWRVPGAAVPPEVGYVDIAPRRAYALEAGRTYRLRVVFARAIDPEDPDGNAIEVRFQNLSASKSHVSQVRYGDPYSPQAGGAAVEISVLISRTDADGIEYVPPATARYFTPILRAHGAGVQETDIALFEWEDVTDILLGGADVADLRSDLDATQLIVSTKLDANSLPVATDEEIDIGTETDPRQISPAQAQRAAAQWWDGSGQQEKVQRIDYLGEQSFSVTDDTGAEVLSSGPDRFTAATHEVRITDDDAFEVAMGDGVPLRISGNDAQLGPLSVHVTSEEGIEIGTKDDLQILNLIALATPPEISYVPSYDDLDRLGQYPGLPVAPTLVAADDWPLPLYVASLVPDRTISAMATMSGGTISDSSDMALHVSADRHGDTYAGVVPHLILRDTQQTHFFHTLDVDLVDVTSGTWPSSSPNVLIIGDSISNRGLGRYMDDRLGGLGYDASWIGTMLGAYSPASPASTAGVFGEAREAYATDHYTYARLDSKTNPITPGDEATYLAMSKVLQRDYNPFIRAEDVGDDPADVRNGYILDFGFYLSRFSLATPDVIFYGLGMNDYLAQVGGDYDAQALADLITSEEGLFFRRLRAEWPTTKIIRWIPPLPRDADRDAGWRDLYVPMIRAVLDLHAGLADANTIISPSWASVNPEAGYTYAPGSTDAVTGVTRRTIYDPTHPQGSAFQDLSKGLSHYLIAAHLNLV